MRAREYKSWVNMWADVIGEIKLTTCDKKTMATLMAIHREMTQVLSGKAPE